MLVVTNVFKQQNWNVGDSVEPIDYEGDVVIAIDPSKTNMAMFVHSCYGRPLRLVEFSGNNRSAGPAMDTTQYLYEVREYMKQLFSKCKVAYGGIEAAITKRGNEYHHSALVLNEIRGTILNFFLENYGLRLEEVNNWSWKAAILPDGYRSRNEKGSKRWIRDIAPQSYLAQCYAADATDAYCISLYLLNELPKVTIMCDEHRETDRRYEYTFVPNYIYDNLPGCEFMYSNSFSLKENLDFYVSLQDNPGKVKVPVAAIALNDISRNASFVKVPEEREVGVYVQPC